MIGELANVAFDWISSLFCDLEVLGSYSGPVTGLSKVRVILVFFRSPNKYHGISLPDLSQCLDGVQGV